MTCLPVWLSPSIPAVVVEVDYESEGVVINKWTQSQPHCCSHRSGTAVLVRVMHDNNSSANEKRPLQEMTLLGEWFRAVERDHIAPQICSKMQMVDFFFNLTFTVLM